MKVFHMLTIMIAILFFIGLFSYTAIIQYLDSAPVEFPGDMTSCPDYWEIDEDGHCIIPTNPGEVSYNNRGHLEFSQNKSYSLYNYYQGLGRVSTLGSNYLEKYNDDTVPGLGTRVGEKSGREVYRYNIGLNNDIPAGYDSQNQEVINFKDPQWAMKTVNKGFGDPYCGIGEWVKQNGIQWDSINAYYKIRCKK